MSRRTAVDQPPSRPTLFNGKDCVIVVTRVPVPAVLLHVAYLAAVEALALKAFVLPCTVAHEALEGIRALELAAVRSSLQRTLSTFLLVEALVP